VTQAFDADKEVEISVRPKDCSDSVKLNPAECALARAAKREHKADGAIIGMSTSYIIKGKTAIRFQTPERVQREIVSFDRHGDFEPGDYYLVPKSRGARLGATQYNKPTGPKKVKPHIHRNSARVRILPRGSGE
jgi:hypothetical protein